MQPLTVDRVSRLSKCWKLQRPDGLVLGFTDHDKLIIIDGVNYTPRGATGSSAEERNEGFESSNRDVMGAITSDLITNDDLRRGLYRGTRITEFVVDYRFPWRQQLTLQKYIIEEVEFDDEVWRATVISNRQRLGRLVGDSYSRLCHMWARFGDADCGATPKVVTGRSVVSVVAGEEYTRFVSDVSTSVTYLEDGVIEWTSGPNTGYKSQVKLWERLPQRLSLYEPPPYAIAAGHGFKVTSGCDRTIDRCINDYDNAVNFGGEPDIPGTDAVIRTPNATQ